MSGVRLVQAFLGQLKTYEIEFLLQARRRNAMRVQAVVQTERRMFTIDPETSATIHHRSADRFIFVRTAMAWRTWHRHRLHLYQIPTDTNRIDVCKDTKNMPNFRPKVCNL